MNSLTPAEKLARLECVKEVVGFFGHKCELYPTTPIYRVSRVRQFATRNLRIHDSLFIVIRFSGTYKQYLVCVRRVFACMAQGGAPYGPR